MDADRYAGVTMGFSNFGFAVAIVALSTVAGAQTTKTPAAQPVAGGLEGSAWNAVSLSGLAVAPEAGPAERRPHLVFGEAGHLSGADGCNRLTGPYNVKANSVTFGQIALTRMFCPGTEDISKRFAAVLKGTSRWAIVKGRLELYGETGKPLGVFERRAAVAVNNLQGTKWQLVRFQGGDDRTLTPRDPTKYTIEFAAGGQVAVQVDCNRRRGSWKSAAANQMDLGPLALTRARCADSSMHDQMTRQWTSIRSFVIKDGRLFLSLKADGGIYEFSPLPRARP